MGADETATRAGYWVVLTLSWLKDVWGDIRRRSCVCERRGRSFFPSNSDFALTSPFSASFCGHDDTRLLVWLKDPVGDTRGMGDGICVYEQLQRGGRAFHPLQSERRADPSYSLASLRTLRFGAY